MGVNTLTIVMYHYVRPIKNSRYPFIKGLELDGFRRQLDYLENRFNVISAGTLIDHVKGNSTLPRDSCLLTFDDGYRDHFLHVFPELRKRRLRGCFFPPAKAVAKNQMLDVNKIQFILSEQPDLRTLLAELRTLLLEFRTDSLWNGLDAFESYWERYAVAGRYDSKETIFFKRMLQHVLPESIRRSISDTLFRNHVGLDPSDFACELYMSENEVKEMVESGMYVGSHGYEHVWLDKETKENQKLEIDLSLEFLTRVGASSKDWIMCYPFGGYNADTLDLLRTRSCCLGLTTKPGLAELRENALLELSRFDTNDFPQ